MKLNSVRKSKLYFDPGLWKTLWKTLWKACGKVALPCG